LSKRHHPKQKKVGTVCSESRTILMPKKTQKKTIPIPTHLHSCTAFMYIFFIYHKIKTNISFIARSLYCFVSMSCIPSP
jgi:hypothetical protein